MNILLSFYYFLPKFENKSILYKIFIRLLARGIKFSLDLYYPIFLSKTSTKPRLEKNFSNTEDEIFIASMTSFPARIEYTYISLECLFRQSHKPDRIILWLAKAQFPNNFSDLPQNILDLQTRGLEIKFCEDIRSHKKYYYSMLENEKSNVIMFDDDLYYHKDLVKYLIANYRKNPQYIIASRVHKMAFNEGELQPYRSWQHNFQATEPSLYLHHTSGNGTLIPAKKMFDDILFDKKLLMELSPNSDDVWWKINLIRMGIKVFVFSKYNRDPITVKSTHNSSLVSSNTFEGAKDLQFHNCLNYFGLKFSTFIK